METGIVTSYRNGDLHDEYAGEMWWSKAKLINVYRLQAIGLDEVESELRDPVFTFEDTSFVEIKARNEHITIPKNNKRRDPGN